MFQEAFISVLTVATDGSLTHVEGSPFDMDELDGEASGLLIAE